MTTELAGHSGVSLSGEFYGFGHGLHLFVLAFVATALHTICFQLLAFTIGYETVLIRDALTASNPDQCGAVIVITSELQCS